MARRAPNPIRQYKKRHDLTYIALAERLGISEDYAKKLGSDGVRSVPVGRAKDFERRTRGGIRFADLVRWMTDAGAKDGSAESAEAVA